MAKGDTHIGFGVEQRAEGHRREGSGHALGAIFFNIIFPGVGNLYYKNDEEGVVLAGLNMFFMIAGANFYLLTYMLGSTPFPTAVEPFTFTWMNWLALITICASWLYLAYSIAKR